MSNFLENQPEPVATNIEERHFPNLYQSADQASLTAQRNYFRLQTCHVACLILGSAGAVLATVIPIAFVTWAYLVLAIVLAIGIVAAWVCRERQYDRVWFDCRAIAESTKTATWRFMMKAAPFKDDRTARQPFIDQLQRIRKARPSSPKDLAQSLDENARSISCSMDIIRHKPLIERQKIYLKSRLLDQKIWYLNKAKFNSRKESFLFWAVLILQILAVFFAIIRAASSGLPVNVVPLLMTIAASAVAWSQMKRYGDLAQTYSLAAQELADQQAIALDITEEADFLELVKQVEDTISREHTMWCVRRDVIINPTDRED